MKNNKGFTIIELMVIVGIIAMILVLIFVNLQGTKAGTRDRVRVAHAQQIRLALEEYKSQCGEYPASLDLSADNGNCPSGFTLESVLFEVPENPSYVEEPPYYDSEYSGDLFNGYMYSGITTRLNGPCYDYHFGFPVESSLNEDGAYDMGEYLNDDHDCSMVQLSDTYSHVCSGSESDFDGDDDENFGVYDFRSAQNCS